MDIKLKNNKSIESNKKNRSKYIVSFISFILILLTSVGICMSYPTIKYKAENYYKYNSFENENFLNMLYESNYSLYYRMQAKKQGNEIEPADLILDSSTLNNYSGSEVQYQITRFNDTVYRWLKDLDDYTKNLEYYVVDKKTGEVESRNNNLEVLATKDSQERTASIERLESEYEFFITMDFDELGRMNIKNIYGADSQTMTNKFMLAKSNDLYNYGKLKSITNTTFVYAIPKELVYSDRIVGYVERGQRYSYESAAGIFIGIAAIFILLCAVLIPYKYEKNIIGLKSLSKVPFEIFIAIVIIAIVFIALASELLIMPTNTNDFLLGLYNVIGNININKAQYPLNMVVELANILYWVLWFGILFISAVFLKYIWNKGILSYLKDKSIIFRVLRFIKQRIVKVYNYAIDIDLRDKNTKKIVILLGINLAIMSIMCLMFFFGIIVAIIYSVVLFRIITKYLNDITNKYNKLFEATNKIADGNLDVTIQEDLGVFNPFKTEIESIQEGFKNAVEEEVKSQRMKTELISNVSHDLKTPLTSIITYVDLLKDENLPIEKRQQYLEILDRKSERLRELIEDLFEVSKATSGNINLNIVDVDVVSMVKQTLLEHDDKISQSKLIIRKNFPEGKVILPLDSQRMFRVLENLVINITKYAMISSRVYIDIVDLEDKVQIIFKNMAATEIQFNVNEIVERFVRGDKSRNTEGSGLGLAIAKSFVELQGGEFKVDIDGDLFKVTITFNK